MSDPVDASSSAGLVPPVLGDNEEYSMMTPSVVTFFNLLVNTKNRPDAVKVLVENPKIVTPFLQFIFHTEVYQPILTSTNDDFPSTSPRSRLKGAKHGVSPRSRGAASSSQATTPDDGQTYFESYFSSLHSDAHYIDTRRAVNYCLDWCSRILCAGADPDERLAAIATEFGGSSGLCGTVWKPGTNAYRCHTCERDRTSAICVACFRKGDHAGHNYALIRVSGGCCDCGDVQSWDPEGFCSDHAGPALDLKLEEALPADVLAIAPQVVRFVVSELTALVAAVHKVPTSEKKRSPDAVSPTGSLRGTERNIKRTSGHLHHSASESGKDRLSALDTALETGNPHRMLIAVDPGHSTVLHTVGYDLLTWLHKILDTCDGLKRLIGIELCQPTSGERPESPELLSPLHTLMSVDTKLPKKFRGNIHSMYYQLLIDQEFKEKFIMPFMHYYPAFIRAIQPSEDKRDASTMLDNFCVQLFTIPTLTPVMVRQHGLLDMLLSTLLSVLTRAAKVPTQGGPVVDCGHKLISRHVYWRVTCDIRYVLGRLVVGQYMVHQAPELFTGWLQLMCLLQNMNLNTRYEIPPRIDGDSDRWPNAFTLELELLEVLVLIINGFRAGDTPVSLSTASTADQPVPEFTESLHQSVLRVLSLSTELLGHWFESQDFEMVASGIPAYPEIVGSGPQPLSVSFHLPLHRILSALVYETSLGWGLSVHEMLPGKALPRGFVGMLIEHPLRIQVMLSQVRAKMWRANGQAIQDQCVLYKSSMCHDWLLDLDILTLQVGLTLLRGEIFTTIALSRFGLVEFFRLDPDASASEGASQKEGRLAGDFLGLLVTLTNDRTKVGMTPEMIVRRELVHRLCVDSQTHSQLQEAVSSRVENHPSFEKVLAEVADFRKPQALDQGSYHLKLECWKEFDPYFLHYNATDLQQAETRFNEMRPDKENVHALPQSGKDDGANLFESFAGLDLALHSATVLQLLFSVLHNTSIGSERITTQLLVTALHMLWLLLKSAPRMTDEMKSELIPQKKPRKMSAKFKHALKGLIPRKRRNGLKIRSLNEITFTHKYNTLANIRAPVKVYKGDNGHTSILSLLLKLQQEPSLMCAEAEPVVAEIINLAMDQDEDCERLVRALREDDTAGVNDSLVSVDSGLSVMTSDTEASAPNSPAGSTGSPVPSPSSSKTAAAAQARKDAMKARQAAILAQFTMQRSSFAGGESTDEEESESSGDENADTPVAGSSQWAEVTSPKKKKADEAPECVLCHEDDSANTDRPLCKIALVERTYIVARSRARVTPTGARLPPPSATKSESSESEGDKAPAGVEYIEFGSGALNPIAQVGEAVRPNDAYCDRDLRPGNETELLLRPLDDSLGVHIQYCGHHAHYDCFDRYFSTLIRAHFSKAPYEGEFVVDLSSGEFLCPCRKMANALLPLVPESCIPLQSPWRPVHPSSEKAMIRRAESGITDPKDPIILTRTFFNWLTDLQTNVYLSQQMVSELDPAVLAIHRQEVALAGGEKSVRRDSLDSFLFRLCAVRHRLEGDSHVPAHLVDGYWWSTIASMIIEAEHAARGHEDLLSQLDDRQVQGIKALVRGAVWHYTARNSMVYATATDGSAVPLAILHPKWLAQWQLLMGEGVHTLLGADSEHDQLVPALSADPLGMLLRLVYLWPPSALPSEEGDPLEISHGLFKRILRLVYPLVLCQAVLTLYSTVAREHLEEWGITADAIHAAEDAGETPEHFACWVIKCITNDLKGPVFHTGSAYPREETLVDNLLSLIEPFLRQVVLLYHVALNGPKPPVMDAYEDTLELELSRIFHHLDLPDGLTNAFKISADGDGGSNLAGVHTALVQPWCEQFLLYGVRTTGAMSSSLTRQLARLPTLKPCMPFSLVDLPELYEDLFHTYSEAECSRCGGSPSQPALCVLCGTLVCLGSACCRLRVMGELKRVVAECTLHARSCGGGTGMFVVLKASTLLLVHDELCCFYFSPYLDDHGEEDQDLRRGRPLFLSRDRLEQIKKIWIKHGIVPAILETRWRTRSPTRTRTATLY